MPKISIKPLTVNRAYQGRRFKTPEHNSYRKELMLRLPDIELPKPPYIVYYEFGFSNSQCDYDNAVKPFQDALQERYGFNDKDIAEAHIKKVVVRKGHEYIYFDIWGCSFSDEVRTGMAEIISNIEYAENTQNRVEDAIEVLDACFRNYVK